MGVPWIVSTPEQVAAFKRDWAIGMPLDEMAALHGFRNINGVSRTAKRLGLEKRAGGPPPGSTKVILSGGRWVQRGTVQYWVDEDEEDAEAG